MSGLWNQAKDVFQLYTDKSQYTDLRTPGVLPHTSLIWINLDFRMFSYLGVNDTVAKVLFGSTYDVVTTGRNYNPNAILAHNSYKEMYLAGGLVHLSLFLILFGITARKSYYLIKHRRLLYDSLSGTTLCACLVYFVLLFIMFVFPLYHYPGIGQIFWISLIIINVVYARWPIAGVISTSGNKTSRQFS